MEVWYRAGYEIFSGPHNRKFQHWHNIFNKSLKRSRHFLFFWLQEQGNITTEEMRRTFNLGIGMILVIPKSEVTTTLAHLHTRQEPAWVIGHITHHDDPSTPKIEWQSP